MMRPYIGASGIRRGKRDRRIAMDKDIRAAMLGDHEAAKL